MMKLKGMRQTYCVNYQARAGQHGLLVVYDRSGPAICFVFLRFSGADSCIHMRVWRQLAHEAQGDVTTSRSSGLAGYLAQDCQIAPL